MDTRTVILSDIEGAVEFGEILLLSPSSSVWGKNQGRSCVSTPEKGRKSPVSPRQFQEVKRRNPLSPNALSHFRVSATRILAKHRVAGSTPVARSPKSPELLGAFRVSGFRLNISGPTCSICQNV